MAQVFGQKDQEAEPKRARAGAAAGRGTGQTSGPRASNLPSGDDYAQAGMACLAEKGKMEQEDACVKMGLQDALELLPLEMHSKIVPATRTFVLRRTSKTMLAAVQFQFTCGCLGEERCQVPQWRRAAGQVERLECVVQGD